MKIRESRTVIVTLEPFDRSVGEQEIGEQEPVAQIKIRKLFRDGEWQPAHITWTERNVTADVGALHTFAETLIRATKIAERLDASPHIVNPAAPWTT